MALACTYVSGNAEIQALIDETVAELPDRAAQELARGSTTFFSVSAGLNGLTFPATMLHQSWPDASDHRWIIVLDGGLMHADRAAGKAVIAHEIAHAFLGHMVGNEQDEAEADQQALSWGFESARCSG